MGVNIGPGQRLRFQVICRVMVKVFTHHSGGLGSNPTCTNVFRHIN